MNDGKIVIWIMTLFIGLGIISSLFQSSIDDVIIIVVLGFFILALIYLVKIYAENEKKGDKIQ